MTDAPILIPAIDLKDGRCVRLRQGRMEDATTYGDDPVAMARSWVEQGARRLHLVDLDGAFAGEPRHREVVGAICADLDIPVQIGGGIRDDAAVADYLEAGARWVIVGTRAARDPDWVRRICAAHPGRIIVGIDARDGRVATEGWAEAAELTATELARALAGAGVAAIVYTDIDRDGMLSGVNLEATVALAEAVDVPVIASGGLSSLDDVRALRDAASASAGTLLGAISGRALYEGTLDLAEASALLSA